MQTRKNRKNDEDSYEKILKLVHDMSKAQQLFDMTARREKQKLALIDMESDILMKRMEMCDFGASNAFNEFTEKMRLANPVLDQTKPFSQLNGAASEDAKKRKKVRRKIDKDSIVSKQWLKKNAESWDRPPVLFGQNGPPGVVVTAKPARENAPDGRFTFKRRRGCTYRAARPVYPVPPPPAPTPASTTVPSAISQSQQLLLPPPPSTTTTKPVDPVPAHMRFYETFVPHSSGTQRCIGFARRRVGRGGRVFFDRLPKPQSQDKVSSDPWAEYCVSDTSRTFRKRHNSLATEEESEELSPKSRYFARSDRVNFNDDEFEREWTSRYQHDDSWKDTDDAEPSESECHPSRLLIENLLSFSEFEDLEQHASKGSNKIVENDDSEVERMDVEGQEEDAQITAGAATNSKERAINGNGHEKHDKNEEEEEDNDVDMEASVVERVHMTGGKMKPLQQQQQHSPPLSGNGRADRAEPTPVPAKVGYLVFRAALQRV